MENNKFVWDQFGKCLEWTPRTSLALFIDCFPASFYLSFFHFFRYWPALKCLTIRPIVSLFKVVHAGCVSVVHAAKLRGCSSRKMEKGSLTCVQDLMYAFTHGPRFKVSFEELWGAVFNTLVRASLNGRRRNGEGAVLLLPTVDENQTNRSLASATDSRTEAEAAVEGLKFDQRFEENWHQFDSVSFL